MEIKASYLADEVVETCYPFGMSNDQSELTVKISRGTVVFTILLLLSLYFVFLIRDVLMTVFIAFIITVALNPATKKMQKYLKLPRFLSIIVTYLLFISTVITAFSLLLPPLVSELTGLVRFVDLPELQAELQSIKFSIIELGNLGDQIGSSLTGVITFLSSAFEGIFKIFTLIMLSLFMLLERDKLRSRLNLFTRHTRQVEQAVSFARELELQLGGWLRGQVIMMILVGLVNYVGLMLLGVPYALPLAILAGMLEILPNLGPVLAAVPAVLIALLVHGPILALIVLVFYIIVQQLESNLLSPKVIKDTADISPFMSVLSIVIGYTVGGIAGAFLALPTYIVLRVIFTVYFSDSFAAKA